MCLYLNHHKKTTQAKSEPFKFPASESVFSCGRHIHGLRFYRVGWISILCQSRITRRFAGFAESDGKLLEAAEDGDYREAAA